MATFILITDQRSVAFMFTNEKRTKIKNAKIQEWRLELSAFDYTIKYHPGKGNVVPDALSLAGMTSYIHSDRTASFMSKELRGYFSQKGVATSKTTPYYPTGNAQVVRFNGTIWKAIQLAVRSWNITVIYWELVLRKVLHSVKLSLCVLLNTTPSWAFLCIPSLFITQKFFPILANVTRSHIIKVVRNK